MTTTASTTTGDTPAVRSKGLAELIVPAILFGIAIFLIIGTLNMVEPPSVQKPGPTFFPIVVIIVLVTMGVLSTISVLRSRKDTIAAEAAALAPAGANANEIVGTDADGNPIDAEGNTVDEIAPEPPKGREPWPAAGFSDWKAMLTVLGSLVAFVVLLRPVGWILAAGLLFWGVSWALGSRRPIFDISLALVFSSVIQILFGTVLGIGLPAGFVEGLL